MRSFILAAFAALSLSAFCEEDYKPDIFPASGDAEAAIKNFQLPKTLKAEVFAAEPQLANPVGLHVDLKGRVYILETFRAGLSDIDGATGATIDTDMPLRTVDERAEFLKKKWGADVVKFTKDHERLRLLEDRDGDGRAERDSVFISSNGLTDGIGAGVVSYKNDVYWANVPRLWKLRDTDGDGKADVRDSLHYGYGVHGGIRGHDLHGLRVGPDGKLYFNMGDRGLNVSVGGKSVEVPDTGAVLRCNLDGSELEIFCIGLRNPHDLAFDEFGNLFTCDNDSGIGDKCRIQYLVEGADNGWRNGYQFIHLPQPRGMWNTEKLWQTAHKGQAAYVIPAISHLTNGPAGMTFYPGTGFPEHFNRRFFLADFRYGAADSGLHTFRLEPKGASFDYKDHEKSIWSILLTDADFGPDSQLYCSDWVAGGAMPKKGRVYRIFDPERAKSELVQQTKKLLNEGMEKLADSELITLLAHTNLYVRCEAQFELAARGAKSVTLLAERLKSADHQLARIHAVWALGQIGRKDAAALNALLPILSDADAEVRAQAAKTLGDCRCAQAFDGLIKLLKDTSARPRFFAAIALGKLGRAEALEPLLEMLRENADADPFLRHAAVMGLSGTQKAEKLATFADDFSPAVRMGALVALRRHESPEVARFLNRRDPLLELEAARAIHDLPIPAAMPQLAKLINLPTLPPNAPLHGAAVNPLEAAGDQLCRNLLLRVINANYRLGQPENIQALAAFAMRTDVELSLRVDALEALADWAQPRGRDRVLNLWRPLPARDASAVAEAVKPFLLDLIKGSNNELRAAACQIAAKHKLAYAAPALHAVVCDEKFAASARVTAFNALAEQKYENLSEVVRVAFGSSESKLRQAALPHLAGMSPADSIPLLGKTLESAPHAERQTALSLLAKMKRPEADAILIQWFDKFLSGQAPAEIQLDLLNAAQASGNAELKARVERYTKALDPDDELAPFKVALSGGDSTLGRKVFFENEKVQCSRCHKVKGKGGEVGPDLSKIAGTRDRKYLLEAVIAPNAQIAPGFETNMATLNDGRVVIGMIKKETEQTLALLSADGKITEIKKDEIKTRKRPKESAMPPMGQVLTKNEIRDLIEFLSTLK
ncbi:MAG TPA: PVC-type heme-binding CxxCH protein [Planctomycetota bacterium]|nr:PVC-type heme-binding CxxCH protein [Planctomycetota bacterium]